MAQLNFGGKEFVGGPGVLSLEDDFKLGSLSNLQSYVYEINRVRAFLINLQKNGEVFEPVEISQNPATTPPPLAITVTPPVTGAGGTGTVGTNVTAGPASEVLPNTTGGTAQPSSVPTATPSQVGTATVSSTEPGAGPAQSSVVPGTTITTNPATSPSGSTGDSQVASPSAAPNTVQAQGNALPANAQGTNSGLTSDIDNITIEPRLNQLSDFASYTYNIELFLLSPKRYVSVLQSPQDVSSILANYAVPVVRTGGLGPDISEDFNLDFFIDNLNITNLATGPSQRSTNTNAIEVTFEIREPNGVTLLERLKNAATTALEEKENYINAPYMLRLTFKGYDDTGAEIVGAIKPKHIPIKITRLRFNVTESGSTYYCKAIPYHHDVFNSISSTIPVTVQVSAGTVKDVFTGAASVQKQVTEQKTVSDELSGQSGQVAAQKTVFGEANTTLQDAMNNFYKEKTKPIKDEKTGKTSPGAANIEEKISFEFAPEIGNAKVQSEKFDALNTPQANEKAYKTIAGAVQGKVTVDKNNNLFKINAGTSIPSLINYVIVASNYIDGNLINQESGEGTGATTEGLKWFKIIPEITEFIGWDSKDGRYKFHIKYNVILNTVHYEDFPWAKKSAPKGSGVHKVYNYIFSGENTEVQRLKLDFNAAYYDRRTLGTGTPDSADEKNVEDVHAQIKDVSTQDQGIVNDETVDNKRKKDFFSTVMHSGIDLVNIELDILGDPAYFPSADTLYQPQGNGGKVYNSPFMPDGTINYDLTPPYIQINLKTPTDYDPVSGLMDLTKDEKYSSSQFNGVYRVLRVKSSFQGGTFTQVLSAFRTKMQPVKGRVGRNETSVAAMERKFGIDTFSDAFQQISAGKDPLSVIKRTGVANVLNGSDAGALANKFESIANTTSPQELTQNVVQTFQEEAPANVFNRLDVTSLFK